MSEQKTTRRKTVQAIKIGATWTPGPAALAELAPFMFGMTSPLNVRGGRLTINAAIAIDMSDPSQAAQVASRVQELRRELEAKGTVHSFITQAGAVPADAVEHLPMQPPQQEEEEAA